MDPHMSQTTFKDPVSGWAAECRDCPPTIDPDYGAKKYPRGEFTGPDAITGAENWAAQHNAENEGHKPQIEQFHRWTMEVTDFAPGVLEALFGPAGKPHSSSDAVTSTNEE